MASPGDIIFRRNSIRSSSNSDASNDMWDDKVLIDVYDRAINVAQEEVAKRLAMNTNSPMKPPVKLHKKKQKMQSDHRNPKWQIGSKCRAVYSEDGLEYEATVIRLDGDTCTVSFIGYMNEEEVDVDNLKPSAGERARMSQYFQSQNDLDDFNDPTAEADSEWDHSENSNFKPEINNLQNSRRPKKKQQKVFPNRKNMNFNLPSLNSLPFNSFPLNINLENDMPLPPPPTLPLLSGSSSQEDQALSTMLISWYMSGYYTGLYQGQKMSQRAQKKQ